MGNTYTAFIILYKNNNNNNNEIENEGLLLLGLNFHAVAISGVPTAFIINNT